jgi:hypothetical protein
VPCSQLRPPEFRVGSSWADQESHLSLAGGAFTLIYREVQTRLCYQQPGLGGLFTIFNRDSSPTNRTPFVNKLALRIWGVVGAGEKIPWLPDLDCFFAFNKSTRHTAT